MITDVTTKEIKTTTTTDAAGNTVTTTAEYHVYPGDQTVTTTRGGASSASAMTSSAMASSAMATEASSAYESSYGARSQAREAERETYAASSAAMMRVSNRWVPDVINVSRVIRWKNESVAKAWPNSQSDELPAERVISPRRIERSRNTPR